jgi:hypothetical protein
VPQAPLLGGLFIGVLSALPILNLGNCCCLWIFGGGVLAAYLDQQHDPRPTTAGRGAMNGLLAGMLGAVVWLVVALAIEPLVAPVLDRAVDFALATPDVPPELRALLESNRGRSSAGFALNFFLLLCAGAIFSTLGGVLGAALFKRDAPPEAAGQGQPPPLGS